MLFSHIFLQTPCLACIFSFSLNILSQTKKGGLKMKREYGLWSLCGFAATSLLGTLLHFLYDLSGEKLWAAVISGVNESTWEHMKLLFFPMLLFAAVEFFFFGKRRDFWCIQLRSILLGQLLIPVIFYTYNGAFGKSPDWLNIAIFFIAAFFAFCCQSRLFRKEQTCLFPSLALWMILGIAFLFGFFTFYPPKLGLFLDPITLTYGISQ